MNSYTLSCLRKICGGFKPPENLTVSEWADKYRRLSPESSAEAGPWRTKRTPYLKEPMDAMTDPKVRNIVMVAASQIGKTEMMNNFVGYIIDQDPGSVLYIQPTKEDAQKFSKLRLGPMIRDCRTLKKKVSDARTRDGGNTIMQKAFPGGMLSLIGSQSASALASTPVRYIIGDERDRWARSAGAEGDPWELAKARQTTFYNAKSIEVSTPTIKGQSNIERAFSKGTQERWVHQCPDCGEWSEIVFSDIRFDPKSEIIDKKKVYSLESSPLWVCPRCGTAHTESDMRKQPAKWLANNPDAYKKGIRSFWLNAFSSPWTSWERICVRFLEAKDDPEQLKVVYNTLLGQLWEQRGDLPEEDELLQRREDYGRREDGSRIELPDGVLMLTCAIDTQDNRFEYEVLGHGRYGETWGIEKGIIMGRPDTPEPWERIDELISHVWKFKDESKRLIISGTAIDSGGHFTQDVYEQCKKRQRRRVIAIKGRENEGTPYISPPTQRPIRDNPNNKVWLYNIGVSAGKAKIFSDLEVQEPGANYCHFPSDPDAGYDSTYFNGLLSETLVYKNGKMHWGKIPGHERNEPLDIRNYNLALFRIINPDLDAVEEQLRNPKKKEETKPPPKRKRTRRQPKYDDW